jgi:DNA polymerase III alpha subunit
VRVDKARINKRTVDALIKAGAFDLATATAQRYRRVD